jgi:hypothetical protein
VRQATASKTGGDESDAQRKLIIIQELMSRDNHSITRTQLVKKYWMQGNINEWDDCALTLEAAGALKIQSIGNQIVYIMPESQYQELKDYYEGRNK